jgi:hypothetical protein
MANEGRCADVMYVKAWEKKSRQKRPGKCMKLSPIEHAGHLSAAIAGRQWVFPIMLKLTQAQLTASLMPMDGGGWWLCR